MEIIELHTNDNAHYQRNIGSKTKISSSYMRVT